MKAGVTTAEELLRVVTEVREMRSALSRLQRTSGARFRGVPELRPPPERRAARAATGPPAWLEFLPVLRKGRGHRSDRPSAGSKSGEVARELPAANVAEFKKQESRRVPRVAVKTHYELLGVDPTADADAIKKAFRREIARYHPDKVDAPRRGVPGDGARRAPRS